MLVTGAGVSLKAYTWFLEDCCRHATFPWFSPKAFWNGFLAGPQGNNYRHLLVTGGAGPVDFYHLNCEHGTGDSICEFNGAHDVRIFGFKTEGNTVALSIRDSDRIFMYGAGGCGCAPEQNQTQYRIVNSSNVLLANVMGQGGHATLPQDNPFGEVGCDPSVDRRISWSRAEEAYVITPPYDRPVAFVVGDPF